MSRAFLGAFQLEPPGLKTVQGCPASQMCVRPCRAPEPPALPGALGEDTGQPPSDTQSESKG